MLTNLDRFTSTGLKFWRHPEQLNNYRTGNPKTIISTHISPEGSCNLDCSYCSVHARESNRLKLKDITQYVITLKKYGLKAVILTGGGEPTAYSHINELIRFLGAAGLKIGLITNGTLSDRITTWDKLSWVRVSINVFDSWQERISLPKIKGTVGCSYISTGNDPVEEIAALAERLNAEYIRVLPDCTKDDLNSRHREVDRLFDGRFMHQYKLHKTPKANICHQSYFRPYLHESGYVYPCDSVVLNESPGKFLQCFELCHMRDVEYYFNKRIKHLFEPVRDCNGCVFTTNIDMLDDWAKGKIDYKEVEPIAHEDFV